MAAIAPSIVVLTDILMPVLFLTLWLALRSARVEGPPPWMFALPLVLAMTSGLLWTYWPPLASLRLAPPPGGQASGILSLIFCLVSLLAFAPVRQYFRTARPFPLARIGIWRAIYGLILLLIGLGGGLPAGFFWSAALGDIAVGFWAIAITLRGSSVSDREILAWNIAGLIDFISVLVAGSIHLRPFFIANPDLPAANLLPLAGLPVLMSLHILTIWGLLARRRAQPGKVAA